VGRLGSESLPRLQYGLTFARVRIVKNVQVPILVYHRFGPVVADSMTVTTAVFACQLKYFHENGYTVIPLSQLVRYFLHQLPELPGRSLVITVDDGR